MNKKFLSILVLGLALFAWQLTPATISTAIAGDEEHEEEHEEGIAEISPEGAARLTRTFLQKRTTSNFMPQEFHSKH